MYARSSRPPFGGLSAGAIVADRYRVASQKGTTGGSAVYSATHLGLGRNVTLELLLRDGPKARRRFERAARRLAMLRHPNVVLVHDSGVHEGRPFVVFQDLSGTTLADRSLVRGPMPLEEVRGLAEQLLSVLGYLHSRKVVHQDVSAENIALGTAWDGRESIQLTQFGHSSDLGSASSSVSSGEQQAVVRSLTHIAPERILAPEEVDARTDLYAAGAVLYRLLAGVPPFEAGTFAELGGAIIEGQPMALEAHAPDLPLDVCRVVHQALEKKPAHRFESAGAMWTAFANACGRLP